ncbi:MAG: DUF2634 domain-containing protein [Terrisporobacter sp.]|uniref:DUF2634 domain-containing protein n=1 Tax=Terrisporobacter sp. TaxID=1965305 RepID=UPI002A9131E4|nr:DUF2634 domain-containing protein [Terrisporobacter sp.]MDY6154891.1 DUF2634 domain-containing protein [Terrisporobacter sp.]
MSLFPFVSNIEEVKIDNTFPLYKEVAWDFKRNVPIIENRDFKIVEGNEAIKVWVYKALLTPRYQYSIYTWNYGSELLSLIGKAYTPQLTKSEAKRYIEEALKINPYILEVNVLDTDFKDGVLSANVKIVTIYGESEVTI